MLEVSNLYEPDVGFWEVATKGMRNAFGSWIKNDSKYCYGEGYDWENVSDLCNTCPYCYKEKIDEDECTNSCRFGGDGFATFVLGENDFNLLIGLCKAGDASHRKVLRQLPVIMNIKAPLYFWKQLDTYKVGTVANSESTMHCLTKEPFKLEDFSLEYLERVNEPLGLGNYKNFFYSFILEDLNYLREQYLKTKDMDYWFALNQALPQSYNQTRTWSANYEVLVTIIRNRVDHKLEEWRELIRAWLKELPYLLDIVLAMDILKLEDNNVMYYDNREKKWKILYQVKDDWYKELLVEEI